MNRTGIPPAAARDQPERSRATARTIWFSLGGIALVGGIASYGRTLGVIQAVDGKSVLAWFEAALADPTIAAASVNIVDARRQGSKMPWFSLVSIVLAAVVSLGANVVYGAPHPLPRWLVNVWPPVAFLLAFESLMSYLRRGRASSGLGDAATGNHGEPCPHEMPRTVEEAVIQAFLHSRECLGEPLSQRQLSAAFTVSRPRVAELVAPYVSPVPAAALNGTAP